MWSKGPQHTNADLPPNVSSQLDAGTAEGGTPTGPTAVHQSYILSSAQQKPRLSCQE